MLLKPPADWCGVYTVLDSGYGATHAVPIYQGTCHQQPSLALIVAVIEVVCA